MAHNINFNAASGQYSFMSRKENAWHGLGQILTNAPTTKEAIIASHLDYPVEAGYAYCKYNEPLYEKDEKGIITKTTKGIMLPNTKFTYRTDNGIVFTQNGKAVTNQYTIVQNTDAFDFFDTMIGEGKAIIETAGALGSGETIFITAKLPEKLIINKDEIDKYLLLTNSHDGSGSITVLFTNIRVVCNNTLNMALQGSRNKYRMRHSQNVQTKLNDLALILKEEHLYSEVMQDTLTMLASKQINSQIVQPYVYNLFLTREEMQQLATSGTTLNRNKDISTKKKNTITTVIESIESAAGQDVHRGSYLWLYNGITSYLNNVKSYKTTEDKFNNLILDGSANSLGQRAFNNILELAL